MDIQVSSNFERLLFELVERDGLKTKTIMKSLQVVNSLLMTRQ